MCTQLQDKTSKSQMKIGREEQTMQIIHMWIIGTDSFHPRVEQMCRAAGMTCAEQNELGMAA